MKYLFALSFLILFSCSEKHKESHGDDGEWKEMDEFHEVMADVYHPLKDANDLGPVKQHADELAASAAKWAEAELPARVDNDSTRMLLRQLSEGCQQLAKSIKEGMSDEEISTKLTELHDTFHSIMEGWFKAGKKEEGSEEHHDH
ncbi:MAG TPA: hypothetical protein VF473_10565 [Cyclobacteriaceae bacterium]